MYTYSASSHFFIEKLTFLSDLSLICPLVIFNLTYLFKYLVMRPQTESFWKAKIFSLMDYESVLPDMFKILKSNLDHSRNDNIPTF